MTHQILFVDNVPANLFFVERLCGNDFQFFYASNGAEALELLGQINAALIISDHSLPDQTGVEFLKKASHLSPNSICILTGEGDARILVEAINSGVVHNYVTKPWDKANFEQIIAAALEQYFKNKKQNCLVSEAGQSSADAIEKKLFFIPLSASAKNPDAGTEDSSASRIGMYAAAIGQRLGLSSTEIEQISAAAFYHQQKPPAQMSPKGYLTSGGGPARTGIPAARDARPPSEIENRPEVSVVIRHIGENFDGSGLPDGLTGKQIPLQSRIVAVAKAYDRETSQFEINQPGAHNQAVCHLKRAAGTRLDPALVSCFCHIEPIGQIRRLISEGFSGIRRLSVRIFCDAGDVKLGEMLKKIKTTPMLAIETLFLANERYHGSPTAQLMVAANKLGEPGLRQMMHDFGFPLSDPQTKDWAEAALRRACAAQITAAYTDILNPDIAYSLGLLRDVGEILLTAAFPTEVREVRRISDEQTRFNREVELWGVESIQVSRWLLESCGIAPHLAAAINSRHPSMHSADPVSLLLDIACQIAAAEENKTKFPGEFNQTALDILRLKRNDLERIYNQTNTFSADLIKSHGEIYNFVETALI